MNYPTRKIPLSLSALTIAIGMAHTSISHCAPVINDASMYKDKVSQAGNNTNIDLTATQNATLNWDSFNVAGNESVIFNQRNSDSVAMNKIGGNSASEIFGNIQANGHVFLVNQNGFTFGQNAVIDTQGFLATTFDAELNGNTLKLNEKADSAAINISQLNIQNNNGGDTQYIALYSSDINLTGNIEDHSFGENTHISLNKEASSGSILLPGLPIGFSVSANDITGKNPDVFIDSNAKILSENGTVILNGAGLSSLFNDNVNLPNQISAKNIQIYTSDNIDIENEIVTSEKNIIKDLSITSTGDINVKNNILGTELNLHLSAENVTINEKTLSTDEFGHEYSHLGGSNGLNSISVTANDSITTGDSLLANESVTLNGNVELNVTDSEQKKVTIRSDQNISTGDISVISNQDFDLEFVSREINIGNISGREHISNIRLYSDNVTLKNDYSYKDKFEINSLYESSSLINLKGDVKFIGDEINLDSSIFNNINQSESNLIIGDNSNLFSSISLNNVSMQNPADTLASLSMFTKNDGKVFLSGNLNTKIFTLKTDSNESITIEANNDLSINNLASFNIGSSNIKSNNHAITLTGDNSNSSSITLGNIDAEGINITQFDTLNATGSSIEARSVDILIDTNQINLTGSSNDSFNIVNESGKITLNGRITANNKDITIDSGTGGFSLSGIEDAKTITIKNDASTNTNTIQTLTGNYQATNSITASNLQSVSITGNTEFNADKFIDLSGTQISATGDITMSAKTLQTDSISADNITIQNKSLYADSLALSGDLTAKNDLNLYVNTIDLKNDLTLKGDINFLDAKQYTDPENKTGLVYTDTNITPTRINGHHRLTLEATNSDVYLYNMSDVTPLASLTLNRAGDKENTRTLHMIDQPSIDGTSGLSILGGWDWTIEGPLEYTAENQNLDLSGVNLNTTGSITFDIGSGNLALGTIGSMGTTSDLIIKSASRLDLYGDITLTAPAQGYQFSEVSAIQIHKDMTFGALDNHVNVNFGNATIDGTYDLTIYSDDITIGEIGSNIALQDLTITSAGDISFNENITLIGNADISANNIQLNKTITSSGFNIKLNANNDITMSSASRLHAESGDINLSAQAGNIGLGTLDAKGEVFVQSHSGYIFNTINDYKSNKNTSINITSNNLTLLGKTNIGQSVASPVVVDIRDGGVINTESDGNIYLANIANAKINTQGRVIDSSENFDTEIANAHSLFNHTLIEPQYKTTLGLIENASWQVDEEKTIKTISTPNASPNLYYSRDGWRLGY